jgi:hypothetical protein
MKKLILILTALINLTNFSAYAFESVWHINRACIGPKDKEAVVQVKDKAALNEMIIKGEAYSFKAGETVYPIKGADLQTDFGTYWQVRLQLGDDFPTFWVKIEDTSPD